MVPRSMSELLPRTRLPLTILPLLPLPWYPIDRSVAKKAWKSGLVRLRSRSAVVVAVDVPALVLSKARRRLPVRSVLVPRMKLSPAARSRIPVAPPPRLRR